MRFETLRHKPFRIGFLPENTRSYERVVRCLTNAGFGSIRVQINRDHSMATFRLKWGTQSRLRGQRQAHARLLRLLLTGGFKLNRSDLSPITISSSGVEGAFSPVRLR